MLLQSIGKISQRLQDGVVTVSELCAACFQRAKTIENLNAFVYLNKENIYLQANTSDERYKTKTTKGKIDGLPIAVKDNFCTAGIRTSCGSKMLENFVPTYNATVVQRLQDKGAVLFGKCNLDEFAMGSGTVDSVHGYTYNIWGSKLKYDVKRNGDIIRKKSQDIKERIAGGSSGGSAVAVASGACFAALGSDTGGSTRNPASYCGVLGLKPTYGSVSRHGLIPLVNSMDVPGIITRKVEDAVEIFNSISGHDPLDSTTVPNTFPYIQIKRDLVMSGIRVGIPKEYHCPGISSEILQSWSDVTDILEEAGATIKQVSMPHTPLSIVCYSVLNQCEVASNMSRYDGLEFGYRAKSATSTEELYAKTRSHAFNNVVRGRILAGNYFLLQRNYNQYFTQALKIRRLIAEDFEKVWNQGIDVLLTPTTLSEPAELEEFLSLDNRAQCVAQDYCTQPVNMAGCPAVSIPTFLSEKGFPLSLQLIAPNFHEETLLSVAHWIESAVQFPELEIYD